MIKVPLCYCQNLPRLVPSSGSSPVLPRLAGLASIPMPWGQQLSKEAAFFPCPSLPSDPQLCPGMPATASAVVVSTSTALLLQQGEEATAQVLLPKQALSNKMQL